MRAVVFASCTIIGLVCGLAFTGAGSSFFSMGTSSTDVVVDGHWPPQVGHKYPDLVLQDQNGQPCHLSDFSGKIILLELAAVPCKGCQAFAGGKKEGGFAGVSVQPGLDSIHEYVKRFAGVKLEETDEVVLVQLLLYGKSMRSPTTQEVSGWARHFKMDRNENEIVLQGDPTLLSASVKKMIPGFHLIDRDFVFRCDSSGHQPSQDLYRDLLPLLGKLARQ